MANLHPAVDAAPAVLDGAPDRLRAAGAALARGRRRAPPRGGVLLHRYLRDLDFELRAVARADHVITMSPEDAARLRRFLPDLPVSVSPFGVDCNACDAARPLPPTPQPDCCSSATSSIPRTSTRCASWPRRAAAPRPPMSGSSVVGHGAMPPQPDRPVARPRASVRSTTSGPGSRARRSWWRRSASAPACAARCSRRWPWGARW